MGEMDEKIHEALERAGESRLNAVVAVLVAVAATFMALCSVKNGNIGHAMDENQAKGVDAWAYYQAKGTKENIAETMLDQLELERSLLPAGGPAETRAATAAILDRKIAAYHADVAKYTAEKEAIRQQAEGYATTYERLKLHEDQLELAEALLSICLAVFGITALTGKRAMFVFACVLFGLGAVFEIAAFAGLPLHPAFLARILD